MVFGIGIDPQRRHGGAGSLLIFFGKVISIGGFQILYGTIAFLLLAWLMSYILKHTAWGRHVYAVGDDLNGAMLSGVQTDRCCALSMPWRGHRRLCRPRAHRPRRRHGDTAGG